MSLRVQEGTKKSKPLKAALCPGPRRRLKMQSGLLVIILFCAQSLQNIVYSKELMGDKKKS